MTQRSRFRVMGLATAITLSGILAVSALPARAEVSADPADPSASASGTAGATPDSSAPTGSVPGTGTATGGGTPPVVTTTPTTTPTPSPSTTPPSPAPTTTFAATARFAGANITLRRAPDAGSASVGTIVAGTRVQASRAFGPWLWVETGGAKGWAMSSHLQATRSSTAVSGTRWMRATTDVLAETDTASRALRRLGVADTVSLRAVSGAWSLVSKGGTSGWVRSSELVGSVPVTASTAFYRWSAKDVPLRAGTSAGPYDRSLLTIPAGVKVKVTGHAGPWSRVSYAGKTGYVITRNDIGTRIPVKTVATYGRFTSHTTPLRPDTNRLPYSPASASLPVGTKVNVIGVVGPWVKVKVVGTSRTGFVMAKTDLRADYKYSFAVFGTLRRGQGADHIMRGYRLWQTDQRITNHRLYMNRNNGLTFITQGKGAVVAEQISYAASKGPEKLRRVDRYELGVRTPKGAAMYQRSKVVLADGSSSWSYVSTLAGRKYLLGGAGKLITSGDFTKRLRS